ncbi:primosomal N' domain protein [Anaplasma phagocytophilum str. CRT53-1]|uniref:Primosomal N' domain protein n=1 Tax=Anaplasma phagocytophilum str. CRT53-1 TaxID=1359157 RepID=A0A0F3PUR4_ANAPH|nr:primosomal N' domain protein [Anaplasma phagocytophilum str. CRT53-1]
MLSSDRDDFLKTRKVAEMPTYMRLASVIILVKEKVSATCGGYEIVTSMPEK